MADLPELRLTTASDLDYSVPEVWNAQLVVEAERASFWDKFEGMQGSGMPIIRKDDLTKEPGDRIHIQTLKALTGSGVADCNLLQGNEERMVLGQFTIVPAFRRHAMAVCQPIAKRSNVAFKQEAVERLGVWAALYKDDLIFTAATTGATYEKFVNNRANEGALIAGDELDYATVSQLKTRLNVNKAMPIYKGSNPDELDVQYCLVMHDYDAHYLRLDTSTLNWATMQQYANERGKMNPIFSGAMGVLNGMILKSSLGVPRVGNVSRCVAFGGEAFATGHIELPTLIEEVVDYGNQVGYGVELDFGVTRAVEENTVLLHTYADGSTI